MSGTRAICNDGQEFTTTDIQAISDAAGRADDLALAALLDVPASAKRILPFASPLVIPSTAGKAKVQPCLICVGTSTLGVFALSGLITGGGTDSPTFAANSSGSTRIDRLYATLTRTPATASRRIKSVTDGGRTTQTVNVYDSVTPTLHVAAGTPGGAAPALPADTATSFNVSIALVTLLDGWATSEILNAVSGNGSIAQAWDEALPRSQRFYGGCFGDGSDGDVIISTTVPLARPMMYNNLTIVPGGLLKTAGWPVYVKNTLTITASAANQGISCDSGDHEVARTGYGETCMAGEFGGGGLGQTGDVGLDGYGLAVSLGGAGGAGGNAHLAGGGGKSGGAGGAVTAPDATCGSIREIVSWRGHILGMAGNVSHFTAVQGGGGGGGGGGSAGNAGANGGHGGGLLWIAVRRLVIYHADRIIAGGAAGASAVASSGTGGGGGGGGGVLVLVYGSKSDGAGGIPTFSAAVNAAGGPGGAGDSATADVGDPGAAGSNGTVIEFAV